MHMQAGYDLHQCHDMQFSNVQDLRSPKTVARIGKLKAQINTQLENQA